MGWLDKLLGRDKEAAPTIDDAGGDTMSSGGDMAGSADMAGPAQDAGDMAPGGDEDVGEPDEPSGHGH